MRKYIFTFLLMLLSSCGYSSLLLDNEINFSINKIETQNKNQISYKIKNNLKKYINLSNKPRTIDVEIISDSIKRITSKDQKGNAKTFDLTIIVELIFLEDDKKSNKKFTQSFSYQSKSNKFELKKYEDTIRDNLISKIILDIDKFLFK